VDFIEIDYSQDMVQLAQKVNRALIGAGRVKVRHGSVSSLPFSDGMFDLVTAFEAYYFWPYLIDGSPPVECCWTTASYLCCSARAG
jgi:SAM-dependent methyltransferase